jgi:formylglycine-generating enzyme required for sulfatase activity
LPIFLGVGHAVSEGVLAAPYQLLSRLLHARGREEPQRQRDLVFAAELAEDVSWERLERGGAEFSALRADLARALADVVEGTALPAAARVQAGGLLGRLGDLRPGICELPPAMVRIEGGSFALGDDGEGGQQMLLAFEIARYPVTNAQYALFIADDGYIPNQPWWDRAGRAWLERDRRREPPFWNHEHFGIAQPNYPVVTVTWYEAMAFTRWLSQHPIHNPKGYTYILPSEAEWEYAARGIERRLYPWGEEQPDGERANFNGTYGGTTTVGCFPAGVTPEGVQDLAGNMWEWTRSVYAAYPYDGNHGCENMDDPIRKQFTIRGGGWRAESMHLRAFLRFHYAPGLHDNDVGFRLVRHLPV